MVCGVGFVVGMLVVVGDCRLVGLGPVLGNVASKGPHSTRYLGFHVVDSLWDVFV